MKLLFILMFYLFFDVSQAKTIGSSEFADSFAKLLGVTDIKSKDGGILNKKIEPGEYGDIVIMQPTNFRVYSFQNVFYAYADKEVRVGPIDYIKDYPLTLRYSSRWNLTRIQSTTAENKLKELKRRLESISMRFPVIKEVANLHLECGFNSKQVDITNYLDPHKVQDIFIEEGSRASLRCEDDGMLLMTFDKPFYWQYLKFPKDSSFITIGYGKAAISGTGIANLSGTDISLRKIVGDSDVNGYFPEPIKFKMIDNGKLFLTKKLYKADVIHGLQEKIWCHVDEKVKEISLKEMVRGENLDVSHLPGFIFPCSDDARSDVRNKHDWEHALFPSKKILGMMGVGKVGESWPVQIEDYAVLIDTKPFPSMILRPKTKIVSIPMVGKWWGDMNNDGVGDFVINEDTTGKCLMETLYISRFEQGKFIGFEIYRDAVGAKCS